MIFSTNPYNVIKFYIHVFSSLINNWVLILPISWLPFFIWDKYVISTEKKPSRIHVVISRKRSNWLMLRTVLNDSLDRTADEKSWDLKSFAR